MANSIQSNQSEVSSLRLMGERGTGGREQKDTSALRSLKRGRALPKHLLVEVWGTPRCGWCAKAEEILKEYVVQHEVHDVTVPEMGAAFSKMGYSHVPQIFVGGAHVGDFSAVGGDEEDGDANDTDAVHERWTAIGREQQQATSSDSHKQKRKGTVVADDEATAVQPGSVDIISVESCKSQAARLAVNLSKIGVASRILNVPVGAKYDSGSGQQLPVIFVEGRCIGGPAAVRQYGQPYWDSVRARAQTHAEQVAELATVQRRGITVATDEVEAPTAVPPCSPSRTPGLWGPLDW